MDGDGVHNILGKIQEQVQTNAEAQSKMAEQIGKLNYAILGSYDDDSPGLRERIRQLESNESRREWWLRIVIVAALTSLLSLAKDAINWLASHAK